MLPLAAYVVAQPTATVMLERVATWLERNTRLIKIVVSIVFGT